MPHQQYLKRALQCAEIRRGFCAPNPSVGAMIVKDDLVIGEGYHFASGHPHAEVEALKSLGDRAKGATVYVTLEPCCHHGKTPPCTDLLIESGVARVIYGMRDPDIRVAGQGEQQLRAAGIECIHVPIPEIEAFYSSYSYWQKTQMPWITAKLALSLDGKIAAANGKPTQISGQALNEFTHQHRKQSDALLTTASTINFDNPKLNVRLNSEIISKPIYILDSQLRIRDDAEIFNTAASITLIHSAQVSPSRIQTLINRGVNCCEVATTKEGLDLQQVSVLIGRDGIHDLWVEAGGRCFMNLIKGQHLKRAYIYVALKCLGADAFSAFSTAHNELLQAQRIHWQGMGKDALCTLEWDN